MLTGKYRKGEKGRSEGFGGKVFQPENSAQRTQILDTVLATMRRERAQFAVVIDEHGGTSGVVTLEDLFEEVVGEIDETPGAPATPRRDAQGRVRVPGTLRLDELGQLFDLDTLLRGAAGTTSSGPR